MVGINDGPKFPGPVELVQHHKVRGNICDLFMKGNVKKCILKRYIYISDGYIRVKSQIKKFFFMDKSLKALVHNF